MLAAWCFGDCSPDRIEAALERLARLADDLEHIAEILNGRPLLRR